MEALDAFLVTFGVIGVAELGDKTQVLAVMLAARFRRPLAILLGILLASVISQAIATALGHWLGDAITPSRLRWISGITMLVMAAWSLRPSRLEAKDEMRSTVRFGAFVSTAIAFVVAEMGDRTQFATAALAAHYDSFWAVMLASSLALTIVAAPMVWIGHYAADRLPLKAMRLGSAAVFAAVGLWILLR